LQIVTELIRIYRRTSS